MWLKIYNVARKKRTLLLMVLFTAAVLQLFLQNPSTVMKLWASVANHSSTSSLNDATPAFTTSVKDTIDIEIVSENTSRILINDSTLKPSTKTTDSTYANTSLRSFHNAKKSVTPQPTQQHTEIRAINSPYLSKKHENSESQNTTTSWITEFRNGNLHIPEVHEQRSDQKKATAKNKKSEEQCDNDTANIDFRAPEFISAIMSAQNEKLQKYYQQELKINPNLKGYLEIRFTVAPSGKVTAVSLLHSTLKNSKIEQHVLKTIKNLKDFGSCDPETGDKTFRQRYNFGCCYK